LFLSCRCIFELWFAIRQQSLCDLQIILAPEDVVAFRAAIDTGRYEKVSLTAR